MGSEGVKILEQREREIAEMRTHLKNVLKVMESKKVHCVPNYRIIFFDFYSDRLTFVKICLQYHEVE